MATPIFAPFFAIGIAEIRLLLAAQVPAAPQLGNLDSKQQGLGVKDSELYALGNMSSSSPAMFDRRRRILTEARKLIGRDGADFSVRDLCTKAGIAPNTLYNAFGNKENVIALAVLGYFEEFFSRTRFTHPADSFKGTMERDVAASLRNVAIPQYVMAVTRLYFSDSKSLLLRPDIDRIVGRFYMPWLVRLRLERQLVRGVSLKWAESNISAMLFTHVLEWGAGRLDEMEFVRARSDAVLTFLGGLTKGAAQREVRSALTDLHGSRKQFDEYLAWASGALGRSGLPD